MENIYAIFAHPQNGMRADRKQAKRAKLEVGSRFAVSSIEEVASARTEIGMYAFHGETFNSVMFDFVDSMNRPVDIYERGYGRMPEWRAAR